MQIRNHHIKTKKIVGMMKNNTPVIYIETHGGLCSFFGNNNGNVEALGAAPHKMIAAWMSEKKHPEIKWDRQALEEA